jgi:3-oxoadipate enol-lactonase
VAEVETEELARRPFVLPWLPEARLVQVQGRGEFFVRVHRHADPGAPTLMMFHGWTATADLQYFPAYEALAERYSFVAIDHRGHGRGLRTEEPFTLEAAADDAAAVLEVLGIPRVITVGYSMGGPISMWFARRHRERVQGLAVQATALEWSATLSERMTWLWLPVLGATLRSWAYPRYVRRLIPRIIPVGHQLEPYLPWILGEMQRGSPHAIVEAGKALRHHDARSWAASLEVPASALVTTRDRLVKPRKQRALAAALGATTQEFHADHFCTLAQPDLYAAHVVTQVDELVARLRVDSRSDVD